MPESLVTIATFATPMEADMAKNLLASANIEAFVADDGTVGWLWHLGNALGGVKLQVPESNAERASAILASPPSATAGAEPPSPSVQHAVWAGWTCSRCGAQVNPRITICPNCNTPLDDLEALSTPPTEEDASAEDEIPESAGDALARRALKAAIIGLLLCPPLLHLYSIWLLGRLAFYSGEVSPTSMRKIYAAMVIDVVVFAVLPYVISGLAEWPLLPEP